VTQDGDSNEKQVIGSNIQEKFIDLIAHLFATTAQIACREYKNSLLRESSSKHWTLFLADFQGLNDNDYQKLFKAYQLSKKHYH